MRITSRVKSESSCYARVTSLCTLLCTRTISACIETSWNSSCLCSLLFFRVLSEQFPVFHVDHHHLQILFMDVLSTTFSVAALWCPHPYHHGTLVLRTGVIATKHQHWLQSQYHSIEQTLECVVDLVTFMSHTHPLLDLEKLT